MPYKDLAKRSDYAKRRFRERWKVEPEFRERYRKKNRLYYQRNKDRLKASGNKWRKELRLNALKVVGRGIYKCADCGCTDTRVLEINHLNGGGTKEMKNKRTVFYNSIVKGTRKIDDLNILCKPCNIAYTLQKKFGVRYKIVWLA